MAGFALSISFSVEVINQFSSYLPQSSFAEDWHLTLSGLWLLPKLFQLLEKGFVSMEKKNVSALLRQLPVMVMLPLLAKREEQLKEFLLRLQSVGYRAVELLDRDWNTALSERVDLFGRLSDFATKKCPDLTIGLGSVTTLEQAKAFARPYPSFAVMPGIATHIANELAVNRVEYSPAVSTPTEMMTLLASRHKFTAIKIYPARDPKNVSEILIAGGGHYFVPLCTGRINSQNAEEFTKRGWAVGIGSEWFDALETGVYDTPFGGRETSIVEQLEMVYDIAQRSPLRN
jgi:2-dehydro-3-deoxyphosphogluconate aldolase/(4S)-4-hydroxy-2-oxoglutarate aldolase